MKIKGTAFFLKKECGDIQKIFYRTILKTSAKFSFYLALHGNKHAIV